VALCPLSPLLPRGPIAHVMIRTLYTPDTTSAAWPHPRLQARRALNQEVPQDLEPSKRHRSGCAIPVHCLVGFSPSLRKSRRVEKGVDSNNRWWESLASCRTGESLLRFLVLSRGEAGLRIRTAGLRRWWVPAVLGFVDARIFGHEVCLSLGSGHFVDVRRWRWHLRISFS
jgi:hypothetical protein